MFGGGTVGECRCPWVWSVDRGIVDCADSRPQDGDSEGAVVGFRWLSLRIPPGVLDHLAFCLVERRVLPSSGPQSISLFGFSVFAFIGPLV
jgi:hypothetical protein